MNPLSRLLTLGTMTYQTKHGTSSTQLLDSNVYFIPATSTPSHLIEGYAPLKVSYRHQSIACALTSATACLRRKGRSAWALLPGRRVLGDGGD